MTTGAVVRSTGVGRLCLAVVLVVLIMAPEARAGCISAVFVDGGMLVHQQADG